MDFSFPKNLNFNIMTVLLGLYFILLGIAYYAIFHKHHKRNKVELDELVTLVTKFYTRSMLATFFIYIGIGSIVEAHAVKYDRSESIFYILVGIIIISITIINYIFYIKKSLKDYDQDVREAERKRTIKIGEILELIFLIIFMLMPLWQIPFFMEIEETKKLFFEVLKSIGIAIAATVLLITLNPIDIKSKIFNKYRNKENKKIYK